MFDVVTGGAGFIGSHLVDTLVAQGNEVLVIDSLCAGRKDTIARHIDSCNSRFLEEDLLGNGWQDEIAGADRVFHLAADPDVRQSAVNPDPTMQNNIMATYRVLEAMRLHEDSRAGIHVHIHRLWRRNRNPDTRGVIPRWNPSRYTGQANWPANRSSPHTATRLP